MRIGIDARSLFHGGTGDRTYYHSLIPALARLAPEDDFTLYYREADADRETLVEGNIQAAHLASPTGWLWGPVALPPRLKRDKIDVLHAQYLLPPITPCPAVVTIHDITFHLFPQWFPRRAGRIMNTLIPLAARTSKRILTVSECAKRDIVRCFHIPEEKVVVTYNGVGPQFRPIALDQARMALAEKYPALAGDYLLGVGLRGVRKNAGVVVNAARRLQSQGRWPDGLQIALTGSADQYDFPGIGDFGANLVYLGYVADDDLPALYSNASLCFYPSLYEGFGLPPLEAMACGCPVLVSDTSSLPEVVGDARLLLPPEDLEAWTDAITRVLSDESLRADLSASGIARAKTFTWERCAQQTLDVYREVAQS